MTMAEPEKIESTSPPSWTSLPNGKAIGVLRYDASALRLTSKPIPASEMVNKEFRQFAADMVATMKSYNGAGLAAIQCGVPARIITISRSARDGGPVVMVNPVLVSVDSATQVDEEGCLSYPGATAKKVERPAAVKVGFTGTDGNYYELVLGGMQARAVCHEIEHLDGKLLIDRVRPVDKDAFRQQLKKFDRLVKKYNAGGPTNVTPSKKAAQKAKKAARK